MASHRHLVVTYTADFGDVPADLETPAMASALA
jgi:hypothetical protein